MLFSEPVSISNSKEYSYKNFKIVIAPISCVLLLSDACFSNPPAGCRFSKFLGIGRKLCILRG